MKCKRAKQDMALSVGRDLDPASEQALRRHLTNCPRCYDQWNRISASTSLLQEAGLEEAETPSPQLWSSVSRNIHSAAQRPAARPAPFAPSNVLVPVVAVASLLLAVVSIGHSLNNPPPPPGQLIPFDSSFSTAETARRTPVDPHAQMPLLREASSPVVLPPPSPMTQFLQEREQYRSTPHSRDLFSEPLPAETHRQQD